MIFKDCAGEFTQYCNFYLAGYVDKKLELASILRHYRRSSYELHKPSRT
jgi:hypothetical protein